MKIKQIQPQYNKEDALIGTKISYLLNSVNYTIETSSHLTDILDLLELFHGEIQESTGVELQKVTKLKLNIELEQPFDMISFSFEGETEIENRPYKLSSKEDVFPDSTHDFRENKLVKAVQEFRKLLMQNMTFFNVEKSLFDEYYTNKTANSVVA